MLRTLAVVVAIAPALAAQAVWTRQYPNQVPSLRQGSASATDVTPNCILLFGGNQSSGSTYFNDLWRWNGQTWTQLVAIGPSPRQGAAMALDAARGRVVLFGGMDPSNIALQDTWEWNGASWSNRAPAARPQARSGHGLAYDPTRQRIVLFGGAVAGVPLGDTWEWNGTNWTNVVAAGPSPRVAPAMAFDPVTRKVLLFGGADQQTGLLYDDTWTWNGSVWQRLRPNTPPYPRTTSMVCDTARGRVVLIGGSSYDPFPWEWDGAQWRLLFLAGPSARGMNAFAYEPTSRTVVLHGSHLTADTWVYATPYAAGFTIFGAGCAGSTATPTLSALTGLPWLGDQFTTRVAPIPAQSLGALLATGFATLPGIDLAPLGLPGCSGFVDASRLELVSANGNAFADWSVALPNDPVLAGLLVHQQAIVFDPNGPLGYEVSDAATLTLGIR